MASIREYRPRQVQAASASGRRSVGLMVLLFLAVLAAITFMSNVSRRPTHHASAPIAMAATGTAIETPTAAPAAGAATEPTAAPATAPTAAAPAVEPATAAPSESEIGRVIADGRSGLHACYQRALVRDESLVNGDVKVRASVAPSGHVDTVAVNAPPGFRSMSPCLKRAVSTWSFPTASEPYEAKFTMALHGAE